MELPNPVAHLDEESLHLPHGLVELPLGMPGSLQGIACCCYCTIAVEAATVAVALVVAATGPSTGALPTGGVTWCPAHLRGQANKCSFYCFCTSLFTFKNMYYLYSLLPPVTRGRQHLNKHTPKRQSQTFSLTLVRSRPCVWPLSSASARLFAEFLRLKSSFLAAISRSVRRRVSADWLTVLGRVMVDSFARRSASRDLL